MFAVAYLRSQPKKTLSQPSICNSKMKSGTNETSFNTTNGIAIGSHGSTVEGPDSRGTQNEDRKLLFLVRLKNSTAVDTEAHRKQQVFVAIDWRRYWMQLMLHRDDM